MSLVSALGSIDEVRAITAVSVPIEERVVAQADPLLVRGWALDPRTLRPFDSVVVTLAEGAFLASTGISRRDVASAFGIGDDVAAGFVAVLASEDLAPGMHRGAVYGHTADGERFIIGELAFAVRYSPPAAVPLSGRLSTRVCVDEPQLVAGGTLWAVHGWALDERTMLPGASVLLTAGEGTFRADYGYPREDVVDAFGLTAASNRCGFRVDVPALPGPVSPLAAHLIGDDDAVFTSSSRTVAELPPIQLDGRPSAVGAVDAIHLLDPGGTTRDRWRALHGRIGDQVVLEGWAVGLDRAYAELLAVIDGVIRIPIAVRSTRPDVVAKYPNAGGAGFSVSIKLEGIDPGWHAIEILARTGQCWAPTGARATIAVE